MTANTATVTKYDIERRLLEVCNCNAPCPCWVGEDPDCTGVIWAVLVANAHPDRVQGLVAIASLLKLGGEFPGRRRCGFDDDLLPNREGWQQWNRRFWLERWPDFVRFFTGHMTNDAHSTKVFDDAVEWELETDGTTMVRTRDGPADRRNLNADAYAARCW